QSGGASRHGWYEFPAGEGVPHPMVHWRENGDPEKVRAISDLAFDFLTYGAPANRSPGAAPPSPPLTAAALQVLERGG
ncbi:MAG TPA: hypothetical protein VHF22_02335, partial [Planctomycetota bacterium]|nr:hypothetical protein [Planctomycetota bacterium]